MAASTLAARPDSTPVGVGGGVVGVVAGVVRRIFIGRLRGKQRLLDALTRSLVRLWLDLYPPPALPSPSSPASEMSEWAGLPVLTDVLSAPFWSMWSVGARPASILLATPMDGLGALSEKLYTLSALALMLASRLC